MSGVSVCAIGIVTGRGRVEPVPRERMRRATRECLLAVEAVEALLEDGALTREQIAGAGTALVYVTAAAYGASNRAFIEGGGGALHFPYTAPSAVPAEVAIEFGLHGPYTVLIGGAATTIDAIDHAATLLARGRCERAVVLAVETFVECADVLRRGGMIGDGAPPVEAAAAALLVRDEHGPLDEVGTELDALARAEPSAQFACGPLLALAQFRGARAERGVAVTGEWRGRRATTTVDVAWQGPARPGRKER